VHGHNSCIWQKKHGADIDLFVSLLNFSPDKFQYQVKGKNVYADKDKMKVDMPAKIYQKKYEVNYMKDAIVNQEKHGHTAGSFV